MIIYRHDNGYMTKLAAMTIYGKIPLKIFLRTIGTFKQKKNIL